MLSQYLQTVTGIEHLGIVSLVATMALFVGVVVYSLRLDSETLRSMSALPLETDGAKPDGLEGRRS
jgi:hypothetical protein